MILFQIFIFRVLPVTKNHPVFERKAFPPGSITSNHLCLYRRFLEVISSSRTGNFFLLKFFLNSFSSWADNSSFWHFLLLWGLPTDPSSNHHESDAGDKSKRALHFFCHLLVVKHCTDIHRKFIQFGERRLPCIHEKNEGCGDIIPANFLDFPPNFRLRTRF